MVETYYRIAQIVIKIISPFPFYAHNGEDFRCEPGEADYVFRFEPTDSIPKVMEGASMAADLLWAHEYQRADGTYLRDFLWQDKYYAAVSVLGPKEGTCYYVSAQILAERAQEGFELLMYLCLERILIERGCLVLHSSHVAIDGKGLVFSAPSQTGKSTQAELWRNDAGAEVMNGDRSVLRKWQGHWYAFGCPMCGTSNIHRQGGEPLTNIVMLAQGPDNTARRIRGMEAFRQIYPQITVSNWDTAFAQKAMDLVNDLLSEVPVWHYTCTKEPEAVSVLRGAIGL